MTDIKFFLVYLFLTGISITRSTAASNTTEELDSDEIDDDVLSELDFEQFKNSIRRYRRLIPYMSYYVSNYNSHNQELDQLNPEDVTLAPPQFLPLNGQSLLRNPKRITIIPRAKDPLRKPLNQLRTTTTTLAEQQKFIPSVQYNPKDIGGDTDYFMPVRYNKVPYNNEHHRNYEARIPPYPEITNTHTQDSSRYYAKERPVTSKIIVYNPLYERQNSKQVVTQLPEYIYDYTLKHKPIANDDNYYPVDNFESVRNIKLTRPSINYQQPINSIPPRRPVYQTKSPILHETILKSLQLTNQLPEILSRDNIDSSIQTLVEILNLLNSAKRQETSKLAEAPVVVQSVPNYKEFKVQYSQPKVVTETRFQATPSPTIAEDVIRFKSTSYVNNVKPESIEYSDYNVVSNSRGGSGLKNQNVIQSYSPLLQDSEEGGNFATYVPVKPQTVEESHQSSYEITEDVDEEDKELPSIVAEATPSHYQLTEGFTAPSMSMKPGAIRGKPNVDYPTYATIPHTEFSCKDQRYKGFFGDPTTRCQVWHYCDLNGGKASFLCPNGTIFSQVALTCDWWFNVKCEATTQLYVLNERLYKFILPIMPKFPEDFAGPEVDRYLEIKFKEMEAKIKAKKLKKLMEKKQKEKIAQLKKEEEEE